MFGDGINYFKNKNISNIDSTTFGVESFISDKSDFDTQIELPVGEMIQLNDCMYVTANTVNIPFMNDNCVSRVYFQLKDNKLTKAQKYTYNKITNINSITSNIDISNYTDIINKSINTEYSNSTLKKLFTLESVFVDVSGKVHYQASISNPRNRIETVNLDFNTDNNVSRINSITNSILNMNVEYEIIKFNNLTFDNTIVATEGLTESISNFIKKIINFFKEFGSKIKKWFTAAYHWVLQKLGIEKKTEKSLEETVENASPEEKQQINEKIKTDLLPFLEKETVDTLTKNELDELFKFAESFLLAVNKYVASLNDSNVQNEFTNKYTDSTSDSNNMLDKLKSDNILTQFKISGTPNSDVLNSIFKFDMKRVKFVQTNLKDLLNEFSSVSNITSDNIVSLYKQTIKYFKDFSDDFNKKSDDILDKMESLMKKIEDTFTGIMGGLMQNSDMVEPVTRFFQFISIFYQFISQLIVSSCQRRILSLNKIINKFKTQFKELSGDTSQIEFNINSEFEKQLQTKTPIFKIKEISVYKIEDLMNITQQLIDSQKYPTGVLIASLQLMQSLEQFDVPNCFITQIPPSKHPIIVLSNALIKTLNNNKELESILYHEYGHFVNNHVISILKRQLSYFNKEQNYIKYVSGLMRSLKDEHEADMVAVEHSGADVVISALTKLKDYFLKLNTDEGTAGAAEIDKRINWINKEQSYII